jgi:hypothetical protein
MELPVYKSPLDVRPDRIFQVTTGPRVMTFQAPSTVISSHKMAQIEFGQVGLPFFLAAAIITLIARNNHVKPERNSPNMTISHAPCPEIDNAKYITKADAATSIKLIMNNIGCIFVSSYFVDPRAMHKQLPFGTNSS